LVVSNFQFLFLDEEKVVKERWPLHARCKSAG
jgi:hypothetical protein